MSRPSGTLRKRIKMTSSAKILSLLICSGVRYCGAARERGTANLCPAMDVISVHKSCLMATQILPRNPHFMRRQIAAQTLHVFPTRSIDFRSLWLNRNETASVAHFQRPSYHNFIRNLINVAVVFRHCASRHVIRMA